MRMYRKAVKLKRSITKLEVGEAFWFLLLLIWEKHQLEFNKEGRYYHLVLASYALLLAIVIYFIGYKLMMWSFDLILALNN